MKRLLLLLALAAASVGAAPRHRAVRPPVPTNPGAIERVMVVILENQDLTAAQQQPFLASLANRGALFTQFHYLQHPSQPNYIAMVAGDTLGVNDDLVVTLHARNLADLLDEHGVSWKVYAESYPGKCDLHSSISDPSGEYVRRHVALIEFADVQSDPQRCARIVNASELDSDVASQSLPRFSFYIPNDNDNGHDTSVATTDAFMQRRFGSLLRDPRFANGTLLIVTFDEGVATPLIYTAFVGAGVRPGVRNATQYDHIDLLRTIEEIFHLGTLGRKDATAKVIDGIWTK
jgi:hypothetical protein